jgi:glycosyltransferase involved in cell wall biosynthesis
MRDYSSFRRRGGSGSPATVSVIVPVWNGKDTVRRCLQCLYQSTYRDFEVIVVDDGSTDATRSVVAGFPCQVYGIENAGPGAARNYGSKHACGEILFFLDADILVNPDSLEKIVEIFNQRPELDALFGSFNKNTPPENFVTQYKNLLHHYTHQTAERDAATFCGGFGAIRHDRFREVGGFDRRHRFLEDVEMGMRMRRAGMTILLERDLQFTHCKRYSLGSLIRSDLFGRAVPWTRLVLSARVFRNDLNTRTHNVLSVPVSIASAAGMMILPAAAAFSPQAGICTAALIAACVLAFGWLNRRFLGFLRKERGAVFALRGALLLWIGYLYSALGVVIGMLNHLVSQKHAAPASLYAEPPVMLREASSEPAKRRSAGAR